MKPVRRELPRTLPIAPPAMLGVLGGGQLGRFFALAARRLGYRVAVLDPDPGSPAMQVADEKLVAPYNDPVALDRLAGLCEAVTLEFESVPAGSVAQIERSCLAAPRAETIAVLQDRIREKRFLCGIGLPVAPHSAILAAQDLSASGAYPGILKMARQSYDGKGQARVPSAAEALAAWTDMGEAPCVLERRLALDLELSVVLARSASGEVREYPAIENRHRGGILELSVAPARVSPSVAGRAAQMARHIAECLDYVGVLAVEFFVCGAEVIVNEIAPRPHNSGHLTMLAADACQFEQQVRALCGVPLAEARLHSAAAMVNVLGDAWRGGEPDWQGILGNSGGRLELYGKAQARPKRKMGHITLLREYAAEAAEAAEAVLARVNDTTTGRRAA